MNSSQALKVFIILLLWLTWSCNKGPKIIPLAEEEITLVGPTGVFTDIAIPESSPENSTLINNELHTVQVLEVLPTDKYVYLHVAEGEDNYWIATLKTEANPGEYFHYKGSLLQSNFKSKEYNRTFEEIYFVSEIIPVKHGMPGQEDKSSSEEQIAPGPRPDLPKTILVKGSVSIEELVSDPGKYGGLTIQISGQCIKLNADIMGRNWIHLRDGSKDDFDLVITSDASVEVGQIVTMTGVVSLNRDFGAGYQYDIILEGGKIVQ